MPTEPSIQVADIEAAGRIVRLGFSDGKQARFHAIWLRDNAQDAETRDPGNGQRLITIEDVPADIAVATALPASCGGVSIRFEPGGHTCLFDAGWLQTNRYDVEQQTPAGRVPEHCQVWSSAAQNQLEAHDFANLTSDDTALLAYLNDLVRRGAAVVSNAPTTGGTVLKIAELGGPVRETNYGRLFDVRAEPNPINLAYSGLGLQAHTDNPYRDPSPTVQVLHCLENTVQGGDTTLVDGFAAAANLRDTDLASFELLSKFPARFRFDGDPATDLRARKPLIELSPDGELESVRFNNRSSAPLSDVPFDLVEDWYRAWRAFAACIAKADFQTSLSLKPGMAFIVDNRRVLHARSAFSSSGSRWLQGCYADMDAVESRWRVLLRKSS
jgi:gamma-butyrobetaine hydroxylase